MIYFDYALVLDAFAFGNGIASSLGMNVKKVQMALLMVAALITATLVSVSVAIGFVGLVLPHAARFLVGSHHSRLIPATAIIGAIFMARVDAVSRAALAPTPLSVGVETALIGVPAFIVIMARRRKGR
jgi:iron complex transport system permease protein